MPKIEEQKREHDMLLGPLERPALQWLSARMPAWVNPDILTLIGAGGAVIAFISYCLSNVDKNFLWFASLGFIINWFGDSLDGTLARYRKIERPKYGFYVDHTVDAFSQVLFFTGLGLSPFVQLGSALLALTGYFLVTVTTYVGAIVSGTFKISYAKIGPTEMRVIAILINTSFIFIVNPFLKTALGLVSVFDLMILTLAAVLMIAFLLTTISQSLVWGKKDPGRKGSSREQ